MIESGFIVYKFHEVQLAHANVQLEAVMDDYMFPAYSSHKLRSKSAKLGDSKLSFSPEFRVDQAANQEYEVGDAFVRELEFSNITLRLVDKENSKDSSEDHTVAKLTGDTYSTLQRILVHLFLFLYIYIYISFQREGSC